MIYILMADGFEEVEALTVCDMLRRAEIDVKTVSVKSDKIVTGSHNIPVICDEILENISISEGVVIPGGIPGVPNLKANDNVIEFVKENFEAGKMVAAICAGPTLLETARILDGKNAVCYPTHQKELIHANVINENVVTDGNLITSKGPGTSFAFAYEIIKYLRNKELAEKIRTAAQYNL